MARTRKNAELAAAKKAEAKSIRKVTIMGGVAFTALIFGVVAWKAIDFPFAGKTSLSIGSYKLTLERPTADGATIKGSAKRMTITDSSFVGFERGIVNDSGEDIVVANTKFVGPSKVNAP